MAHMLQPWLPWSSQCRHNLSTLTLTFTHQPYSSCPPSALETNSEDKVSVQHSTYMSCRSTLTPYSDDVNFDFTCIPEF